MATRKTVATKTTPTPDTSRKGAPRPTAAGRPQAAASTTQRAAPPVGRAKAAKPPKLRRKPVRDSFTMPEADFALIATLKARALARQRVTKKSELLRAGLHALAALEATALVTALERLEPVKIGRPKKGH